MALPRSTPPVRTVRWTGAGHASFPCTEEMMTAVLRHVGGTRRVRLDPIIEASLEPWGGVTYVAWLLRQIVGCLPADEQVILTGLLNNQSHTCIGLQLHHHRNWVINCIRDRLIPRLVTIIPMVAHMPHYSMQTMVNQSSLASRQLVKG